MRSQLEELIHNGAAHVLQHSQFGDWLKSQKSTKDGLVAINNSFLFREELKTRKNSKYLCVPLDSSGNLIVEKLGIGCDLAFNTDFTCIPKKAPKQPEILQMKSAITEELKSFGRLAFILIGTINDSVQIEKELKHELFQRIILDPTQAELVTASDQTIRVKETHDEQAVWEELQRVAQADGLIDGILPPDLAEPFAKALEGLRDEAFAILELPGESAARSECLLDLIASVLSNNINDYKRSLRRCRGEPTHHASDFNNLLRISYNFASDAAKIVRLFVSICDLKPLAFWCTIEEWLRLSDDFKRLPWSKSTKKPSLDAYQQTIAGARNSSFHNLFPVSKMLQVPLTGVPLGAIRLRFFSEYAKRKNANLFEYQDQSLVEAFIEFTRAGERLVPASFWKKNVDVMFSAVELLKAMSKSLKLIAASHSS